MCLVIRNGILKKAELQNNPPETVVTVPEGVRVIGKQAFRNQKRLTKLILPDNLEVIEACAFYGCDHLKELHIPPRVHTIGDKAFSDCSRLGTFHVPDTLQNCGNDVLAKSSHLYRITVYKQDGREFTFPVRSSCSSSQLKFLLTGNDDEGVPRRLLRILLERMVLSGYDDSQETVEYLFALSVGLFIDDQEFRAMKEMLSDTRIAARIPVKLYEKMLTYANKHQAFDFQLLLMNAIRQYHTTGSTDSFRL